MIFFCICQVAGPSPLFSSVEKSFGPVPDLDADMDHLITCRLCQDWTYQTNQPANQHRITSTIFRGVDDSILH